MRPKKKVLVFCEDPDELGRISYVLWSKHLYPVLAGTGEQALEAAAEMEFHCAMVLAGRDPLAAEETVLALARARPALPIVCFAPRNLVVNPSLPALVKHGADVAAMIEAVRVLIARKRGPAAQRPPRGYLTSNLQRVGSA